MLRFSANEEGIMRGMHAPLSPHEQTALRRVAEASGLDESGLDPLHARRLKQLGLIMETVDGLRLTEVGRTRCAEFDTPPRV